MHRKAIAIWDAMKEMPEERFKYLLELDSRYRGKGDVGNGLLNLSKSLTMKVEEANKYGTIDGKRIK